VAYQDVLLHTLIVCGPWDPLHASLLTHQFSTEPGSVLSVAFGLLEVNVGLVQREAAPAGLGRPESPITVPTPATRAMAKTATISLRRSITTRHRSCRSFVPLLGAQHANFPGYHYPVPIWRNPRCRACGRQLTTSCEYVVKRVSLPEMLARSISRSRSPHRCLASGRLRRTQFTAASGAIGAAKPDLVKTSFRSIPTTGVAACGLGGALGTMRTLR
jgi:hypothetical protein